jgi:hypothetical protein
MYGDRFTTNGATEGPCRHQHLSVDAAAKCLRGDRIVIRNGNQAMWFNDTRGVWEDLSI